jgi:mannose-6-phosphate isomerase-like protein (cupin superfamily)
VEPGDIGTMDDLEAHVVHHDDVLEQAWEGIVSWRALVSGCSGPSAGLTVGIASIPAGSTIVDAKHRHDQHEVYVVTSGTGVVHLDDEAHPVRTGSAVFIPGGVRHCAENTGDDTLTFVYVLAADAAADVVYDFS